MLKKAFIDLLFEKEYKNISVTDIVERADYNRSTFYFHYQYKEELVEELNNSLLNGLVSAFFYSIKDDHTLIYSEKNIFNYIYQKKEFFNLWKTSEPIPNIHDTFIAKFSDEFKKKVSTSKLNSAINADYFVTYLAYGILGLILEWIKSDYRDSPEHMERQLIFILNNQFFKTAHL